MKQHKLKQNYVKKLKDLKIALKRLKNENDLVISSGDLKKLLLKLKNETKKFT